MFSTGQKVYKGDSYLWYYYYPRYCCIHSHHHRHSVYLTLILLLSAPVRAQRARLTSYSVNWPQRLVQPKQLPRGLLKLPLAHLSMNLPCPFRNQNADRQSIEFMFSFRACLGESVLSKAKRRCELGFTADVHSVRDGLLVAPQTLELKLLRAVELVPAHTKCQPTYIIQ
jgi:hypothetical protein